MNGIVIVGMDLPKSCWKCVCFRLDVCAATGKKLMLSLSSDERPDDCPMYEIEVGRKTDEKSI